MNHSIRGASAVHPIEWLDFAESLALSLGHAEPPKEAERRKKQGRSAGLWTKDVPNCRHVVDLILAYAAAGNCLKLEANDVEIGTVALSDRRLEVTTTSVGVGLRYSLFGGEPSERTVSLDYRNNIQKTICTGQWLNLNIGRVQFGSLLPHISWDGSAARLEWSIPPAVELGSGGLFGLGILRRVSRTTLSAVVIGREYGEFETSGVIGWGLPRLRWV